MSNQELSVVKVLDVLLATFPAQLTDQSVNRLQEEILTSIEAHNPEGIVLDISAVDVMDSFFARTMAETTDMVRLMGGETVVVGMQPGVAITAAELGYDLNSVMTARNTDQALTKLGIGGGTGHGGPR